MGGGGEASCREARWEWAGGTPVVWGGEKSGGSEGRKGKTLKLNPLTLLAPYYHPHPHSPARDYSSQLLKSMVVPQAAT